MATLCQKEEYASLKAACGASYKLLSMLSVFLTQRYLQACPDKLEKFCGRSELVLVVITLENN